MKHFIKIIALCILFGTTACGPSVKVSPEFEKLQPDSIALLPVSVKTELSQERLGAITASMREELRNRGYFLLDDRLVKEVCSTPECPNRKKLADLHGVRAFATLTIDSASKNNFGLGYYNMLKGELVLGDVEAQELVKVKNTENESGGLLFNSGQIFQGIKEAGKSFTEDSFGGLAAKFAKSLALQLPRPSSSANLSDQTDTLPTIESVTVKSPRPLVHEICADSAPGLIASVVVDGRRSTLRETKQGRYCGIYRLDTAFAKAPQLSVEVRSSYGDAVRKDVELANAGICDLQGAVRLASQKGQSKLTVSCVKFGSAGDLEACEGSRTSCVASKLVIYRSFSAVGPFEKVAEVKSNTWFDKMLSKSEAAPIYQVVAVNAQGVPSLPVSAVLLAP